MIKEEPMKDDNEFLSLFRETLAIPSPPGNEERMGEFVRSKLSEIGLDSESDLAGNIIVRIPGKDDRLPSLMMTAHMDEIGAVVSKVNSDGTLKVVRSGSLYPWKLGESPVEIIGDDKTIVGVVSMGSTHKPNAGLNTVTWDDVSILTGLSAKQLFEAGVRPGTALVPSTECRGPFIFGDESDPLIGAWTFDDRAGVVTLLRLLKRIKAGISVSEHPLTIAFTVQEEGGCYGAIGLARRENPDIFVAVDGCPVLDEEILPLDGTVGVWSKDEICNYDKTLIRHFIESAKSENIPLRTVVYERAASDASAVWQTGGAQKIAFVGHVRTNSHGFEVARLSCFENVLKVLTQIVESRLPLSSER